VFLDIPQHSEAFPWAPPSRMGGFFGLIGFFVLPLLFRARYQNVFLYVWNKMRTQVVLLRTAVILFISSTLTEQL
jgi:hypothetical protein